jgi:S-DNA-T family DNA segregation ATPase FtsK/SpoIIIE
MMPPHRHDPKKAHNQSRVLEGVSKVSARVLKEPEHPQPKIKKPYFQGGLKKAKLTASPVHGFAQLNSVLDKQALVAVPTLKETKASVPMEDQVQVSAPLKSQTPEIASLEDKTQASIGLGGQTQTLASVDAEEALAAPIERRVTQLASEQDQVPKSAPVIEQSQQTVSVFIPDEVVINEAVYHFPPPHLLGSQITQASLDNEEWLDQQAQVLMETFQHFNLKAELIGVTQGPTVTRFEIQPAPGTKINKFTNLQDDLKLSLAAKEIRIEAPIPGKHAIGIEVPNLHPSPVFLGDIVRSEAFVKASSPLTVCLGADLSGQPVVTDIKKMPHGLIAGSTGSGKSVCINSILISLLYKSTPEQLRLLLIDPKVVELTPYQSIPHLVTPVVTDPKRATASLKWAVDEMERRYQLFADEGVRDLERYNQVLQQRTGEEWTLPYILIIIDELADLMMVAAQDAEDAICRITQKARACGIHLLIATQRPSVDVITGLIKANIPSRIAFSVSSQVDSRTILDMVGAERLLGKGDMLFLGNGFSKPMRLQGNFVSDGEIESIVQQVSSQDRQRFLFLQDELLNQTQETEMDDEIIQEAAFFVMEQGSASASALQRKFRIGYNRAARLIDFMEELGLVSEALGSKPRTVLWTQEQFLQWIEDYD